MSQDGNDFNAGVEAAANVLERWEQDFRQMRNRKAAESERQPMNLGLGIETRILGEKADLCKNMARLVRQERKR